MWLSFDLQTANVASSPLERLRVLKREGGREGGREMGRERERERERERRKGGERERQR